MLKGLAACAQRCPVTHLCHPWGQVDGKPKWNSSITTDFVDTMMLFSSTHKMSKSIINNIIAQRFSVFSAVQEYDHVIVKMEVVYAKCTAEMFCAQKR